MEGISQNYKKIHVTTSDEKDCATVEKDEPGRDWGPGCRGAHGPQSVTECCSERDEKPLEGFEHGTMETSAASTNVFLLFFVASAVGRESDSRRLICRLVQYSERTMEAWKQPYMVRLRYLLNLEPAGADNEMDIQNEGREESSVL